MANPLANLPPQAAALLHGQGKVTVYEETGGKVTADLAAHNLTLIPPIPSGSIVHDSACGVGTVSREILSPRNNTQAPTDITIHATDVDETFLEALRNDILAHSWPVSVSNQRCEALTFSDNTFTHSIMNMGIFFTTSNGLDGAQEMYRTLQPGGIAVVNCWESLPWFLPIKKVHDALRPGIPFFMPPVQWSDGVQIRKVMVEAGFREEGIRVERSDGWARTRDLRTWAERCWAYLGGMGSWQDGDGERWEDAVNLLVEELRKADRVNEVNGEVVMRAGQWVIIATK